MLMASHAGNTGSIPVGITNKIKKLGVFIKADYGDDGSTDGFFIFRIQLYPSSILLSNAFYQWLKKRKKFE